MLHRPDEAQTVLIAIQGMYYRHNRGAEQVQKNTQTFDILTFSVAQQKNKYISLFNFLIF